MYYFFSFLIFTLSSVIDGMHYATVKLLICWAFVYYVALGKQWGSSDSGAGTNYHSYCTICDYPHVNFQKSSNSS